MEDNNSTPDNGKKLGFFDQHTKGIGPETIAAAGYNDAVYMETEEEVVPKLMELGYNEDDAKKRYGALKSSYESLQLGMFDVGGPVKGETLTNPWEKLGYTHFGANIPTNPLMLPNENGMGFHRTQTEHTYLDESVYYTKGADGKKQPHELSGLERIFNPKLVVKRDVDDSGNPIGEYYISEMDDLESNVMLTPYNIWGEHEVFGHDAVYDELKGLISGFLFSGTTAVAGGLIEIIDSIASDENGEQTVFNFDTGKFEKGKSSAGQFGTALSNLARRWAYTPSIEIQDAGFTGSLAGFAYHTSVGIGEFIPQIYAAIQTGGLSAFATGGAKVAVKQIAKQTAKKLITSKKGQQLAEKAIIKSIYAMGKKSTHIYASVGAAQGMVGVYNEMTGMGVDRKTAATFGLSAAPWIYATEAIIGSQWVKSPLGINSFSAAAKKDMAEVLGNMAKNESKKISTDEGVRAFAKRYADKLVSRTAKTLGKSKKAVKEEIKAATKKGATEKPSEVGFKQSVKNSFNARFYKANNAANTIWNGLGQVESAFANKVFNPATFVKGAMSEGLQETLEQIGYSHQYWAYDNWLAPDDALPGKGRMGYSSGHGGFQSYKKGVWGKKAWNSYKESFVGGAAIGGYAAGFSGANNKGITSDNYIAMSVYNGNVSDVYQTYIDQQNELFGSDKMDPELNILSFNGKDNVAEVVAEDFSFKNKKGEEQVVFKKGQELKSQKDVNLYHALLNVKMVESLATEQGFDPAFLQNFVKQEGLLTRAFSKFKEISTTNQEIAKLNKELENIEDDSDKSKIVKDKISQLDTKLSNLKEDYNYLVGVDNTSYKLSQKIKAAEESIKVKKDLINTGEYNEEHKEYIKSLIKEQNDIINNEESDDEQISKAKEEIAKYTELLANGKLSEADISILREQVSEAEVNKNNYEEQRKNTKESTGYSKAYKDTLKNAMSLMAFANEKAVDQLKFKKKLKGVKQIDEKTFTKKEIQEFQNIRNQYISKLQDNDIYKYVISTEQAIDDAISNIKIRNNAFIASQDDTKEKTKKAKSAIDKLKTIVSKKIDFNDVEARFKHIGDVIEAINEMTPNLNFESSPGLANSIDSEFNEVMKLIDEFSTNIHRDAAEYGVEMNLDPTLKDSYQPIISQLNKEVTKFDTFISDYSDRQRASSLNDSRILKEIELGKDGDRLRDHVMFLQIEEFVETLNNSAKNKYSDQSLFSIDKQIEEAKSALFGFKIALNIRKKVFNEMDKNDDRKFLDYIDRTISDEEYKNSMNKIEKLSKSIEKHSEAIKKIIGSNSNYQTLLRRGETKMNIHAITLMLDNDEFKNTLNSPSISAKLKKAEELSDIPKDAAEISTKDKERLIEAETIINDIFHEIWEQRESLFTKSKIKSLLENSFLAPDAFDNDGNTIIRTYNNRVFQDNEKTKVYDTLDIYTDYNNSSDWQRESKGEGVGYTHFVNTLVKLSSDVSSKNIAQTRLDVYEENEKPSSTEQMQAEDEAISYLLGGNKTFDLITEIEIELNEAAGLKKENYSNLSRYKKNSLMITGEVQTGKTMQVTAQTIKILNKLDPNQEFVLVSFSEDTKANFDTLIELFDDELKTKIKVLSNNDVISKKDNINNKIVFWDEATLLTEDEINTITDIANNNNAKIAYIGDASQMHTIVGKSASATPFVEYIGFKTTPVTEKYAVRNPMISELMQDYKLSENKSSNNLKWWQEESKGILRGVEYSPNVESVIDAFIKRIEEVRDKDQMVLTFLSNEQYESWASRKPELKGLEQYIKVLSVDPNKKEKLGSIQGGRKPEVYIAYDGSEIESKGYIASVADSPRTRRAAMYTLIGRTSSYVMLPGIVANKYSSKPNNFMAEDVPMDFEKLTKEATKYISKVHGLTNATSSNSDTSSKKVDVQGEIKPTHSQNNTLSILESIANSDEYVNENGVIKKDGVIQSRISQVIGNKGDEFSVVNKTVPDFVKIYAETGTVLDRIMRDYFEGNLGQYEDYKLTKIPHNYKGVLHPESVEPLFKTKELFDEYIKSLEDFNATIKNRGEVAFSKNIRFGYSNNGFNVTGETDLITVSKDGTINIYDLKSKKLKVSDNDVNETINKSRDYNKNGVTDFVKNSQQINGYAALIENDPRGKGQLKVNKNNGLKLIYLGINMNANLNHITKVYPLDIKHVSSAATNVSEYIRSVRKTEPIPSTYKNKHYSAVVGNLYNDNKGNIVTVTSIRKEAKKAFITIRDGESNNIELEYSDFKKRYNKVVKKSIDKGSITTEISVFKKSGNMFAEHNAIYATPAFIVKDFFDELGINATEDNLNALKALKASLPTNLEYSLHYVPDMVTYSDNGGNGIYQNNLVLRIINNTESRAAIKEAVYNMAPSELKNVLNSMTSGNTIPDILLNHHVLSYPEFEYNSKDGQNKIKLITGSDNEVRNAISQIEQGFQYPEDTSITEEDRQNTIALNIFRVKLLAKAIKQFNENGETIVQENVLMSDIVSTPVPGPKKSNSSNLKDFVNKENKRGFTFSTPKLVNDGSNTFLAVEYSFNGGPKGLMSVTTPLLNSLSNKGKASFSSAFSDEAYNIQTANSLQEIATIINNGVIGKFLQSNSKNIKENNLLNKIFSINGKGVILGDYFFFEGGAINVIPKTKDKVNDEKNAFKILDDVISYYLAVNKKSSSWNSLDVLRVPFDKNKKGFDNYEVNHERMNIPNSYMLTDNIEINNNNEGYETEFELDSNVPFSIKENRDFEYDITTQEATQIVRKIIGDTAADEWTDFIPNLNVNGLELFGRMLNGRLQYDVKGNKTTSQTIRHEIYHLVTDYLISDTSREKVYADARKKFKGGETMSLKDLDEAIADWYGKIGESLSENRYGGFLGKLRMLIDKILGRYEIYSGELHKYLTDIENGKYKESFENFANRNNDTGTNVKYSMKGEPENLNENITDEITTDRNKTLYKGDIEAANALIEVLGNKQLIKATSYTGAIIKKFSVIGGGNFLFSDAVHRFLNIKGAQEDPLIGLIKGRARHASTLSGKDIHNIANDNELRKYLRYNIGVNFAFRRALLKQVFPSINLVQLKTQGRQQSYNDDKRRPSVAEKTSDIINWFNSSLNYFDSNGLIGATIPIQQVDSIMRKAAVNMIKYKSNDDFSNLIRGLKELIKNDGSRYDNEVKSIYGYFANSKHKGMRKNGMVSISEKRNELERTAKNKTGIISTASKTKLDELNDFLYQYTGLYKSSTPNTLADIKLKESFDVIKLKKQRDEATQKEAIRESLLNSIVYSDGSITENMRNLHEATYVDFNNDEVKQTIINENGLFLGGTQLIRIDGSRISFTEEGLSLNNLVYLKRYSGLLGLNQKAMVAMAKNNVKKTDTGENIEIFKGFSRLGLTPSEYLANVFVLFSSSIDKQISQQNIIEGLESYELEDLDTSDERFSENNSNDELIENIAKKLIPNYNKNANEDIISQITGGTEASNLNIETPTNYFSILNSLGEVNFNQMSLSSNRFVYIGGVKRSLQDLNNAITEVFGKVETSDDPYQTKYASTKINNDVLEHATNNGIKNSAYFNENGESNNVFIDSREVEMIDGVAVPSSMYSDKTPLMNIVESIELPGIGNDYTNTTSMTRKDRLTAYISLFMKEPPPVINTSSYGTMIVPLAYNKRDYALKLELPRFGNDGHWYGIDMKKGNQLSKVMLNGKIVNKALKMKFEYYRKENLKSLEKWHFLFKNDLLGFKNKEIMLKQSLEDVNVSALKGVTMEVSDSDIEIIRKYLTQQLDYYITDKEYEISAEQAAALDADGGNYKTINNTDGTITYTTKKKVVGFGSATRFSVAGSSAYNYKNYLKIKDDDMTDELRNKIFYYDMKNNFSYMNEIFEDRYGIDSYFRDYVGEDYDVVNLFYAKKKTGTDNETQGNNWVINPYMEMLFFMTHIGTSNAAPFVFGNDMQSKDIADYVKRNSSSRTGKITPSFGHRLGLNKKAKIIVVKSNKASRNDGGNVETKDGQVTGFLLYKIAMKHNFGGDTFMQFDNTMYKDLSSGADIGTSNELLMKEAIDFSSAKLVERFPKLKSIQMNLLRIYNSQIRKSIDDYNENDYSGRSMPISQNVDLLSAFNTHYEDTKDFELSLIKLWDELMDVNNEKFYPKDEGSTAAKRQQIYKESMIKGFVDESAVKRGKYGVNEIMQDDILSEEEIDSLYSVDIDTSKMGLVVNPGHNIDSNSTNSIMNQMLSHVGTGAHNLEIRKGVAKSMSNILTIGERNFFNKLGVSADPNSWDDNDIITIRKNIRLMGISSMMNIKNSSMLDLLISGVSIDLPQVSESLKQIFRNRYNDNALKPRFAGYKANQASAESMTIYEDESGRKMTYKGLERIYGNEAQSMIENGSIIERELNYMHHDLNEDGTFTFTKSEVIAPYMYKQEFFLTNGFEDYDVSDVFTIDYIDNNGDTNTINLQNIIEEISETSKNKKEFKKKLGEYLKSNINGQIIEHPIVNYAFATEAKNESSIGKDMSLDMLLNHMTNYYYNFDKSLEVILNRTPFDNPKLGFIGKIVSFSEGNGNTIYINPLENVRSGGDFDIDQLSVYFKTFDENSELVEDENTIDGNVNNILNHISNYYKDSRNYSAMYGETSTAKMQKLVDDKSKENSKFNKSLAAHTLAGAVEAAGNIQDGDGAIGIFALASSAYALFVQEITHKDINNYLYVNGKTKEGTIEINKRIARLSNFLQLALDNDKLMLLGEMNIPKRLTGTVVSLLANGKTEEDIYNLFNSDKTKYSIGRIIKAVKKMEDLNESSKNIAELILDQIEYEQDILNDLRDKYKNIKDVKNEANILKMWLDAYKTVKDPTDEQQAELEIKLPRYLELSRLMYGNENIGYMNDFFKAYIAGEGLRRFGRFISNRTGINAVDLDNKLKKQNLELYLGGSIEDYLSGQSDFSIESQMKYYENNSNELRASEDKDRLMEIERKIRETIDIPSLLSKYEYYVRLLEMQDTDSKIMEKLFFVDNPIFEEIGKKLAEKQNRASLQYKDQLVVLNAFKSEIILGNYYSNENITVNIYPPIFKDGSTNEKAILFNHPLRNLSLNSRENRTVFASVFPSLVEDIKTLLLDGTISDAIIKDYFLKLDIPVTKGDISRLRKSSFLDSITKQGFDENESLSIDPNISLDQKRIADLNNEFNGLPKALQKLFEHYALITTNLKYSQRSLSSVLNLSMYEGVSDSINKRMLNDISEDEMNKIIDYLGMNPKIARFFKEEDKPTYMKKSTKIGDYFNVKIHKYSGGMQEHQPISTLMTRTILKTGYQLNDKTPVWIPEIQQIKLTSDEEIKIRDKEVKSISKKYFRGSSYKTGYAVTSSGLIVGLYSSNNGRNVVVSKASNPKDAIAQMEKKAKEISISKNLKLKLDKLIAAVKLGEDFKIALSYKEISKDPRLARMFSQKKAITSNDADIYDYEYYDRSTKIRYSFTISADRKGVTKDIYHHTSDSILNTKYKNNKETKTIFEIKDIKSLNQLDSKLESIMKNRDKELECKGKGKAARGMQSGFTKGGHWRIVKEFKGPSHAKGGIQLEIGEDRSISFKRGSNNIKAAYGLMIPNNN